MKRRDDGIDVHGKSPSFSLYPADLERELQLLSLAASGLWTRMLLRMHFSPNRGFLEHVTGIPMNNADIANLVGKPEKQVSRLMSEMERVGTFSRDDRDCIYNRRLVRDTEISRKRKEAGAAGKEAVGRDASGRFAGANQPATGPAPSNRLDGQKKEQITILSFSSSSSSSGEDKQQAPSGAGTVQGVKNPKVSIAHRERWFEEEFWPVVWLKRGKGAARRAFLKAAKDETTSNLIVAEALKQGPAILAHATQNGHSVLHPATWLNDERWLDEIESIDEVKRRPEADYPRLT